MQPLELCWYPVQVYAVLTWSHVKVGEEEDEEEDEEEGRYWLPEAADWRSGGVRRSDQRTHCPVLGLQSTMQRQQLAPTSTSHLAAN